MNENPLGEAVGFLTSFLELYESGSTDSETWLAHKLWVMDAATESGFEPQPPPEDSEMAELIRIADQFVARKFLFEVARVAVDLLTIIEETSSKAPKETLQFLGAEYAKNVDGGLT